MAPAPNKCTLNRQGCPRRAGHAIVARVDRLAELNAALNRVPDGAAFTGLAALWLRGLDVEPSRPIEIAMPAHAAVSGRTRLQLRRSRFDPKEAVEVRGLPAVIAPRAICDAGRRLSLTEAVVVADAALHHGCVTLKELASWTRANAGRHGVKRLRRVIELAEPASESPMESRLRMLLVLGRLPRPLAQVSIYDPAGMFVGRPDLYYEEQRLGIEYDGGTHRDSLPEDDQRQNLLLAAGVRLLRFTARDVLGSRDQVVKQVRDMLKPDSAGRIGPRAATKRGSAGRIDG